MSLRLVMGSAVGAGCVVVRAMSSPGAHRKTRQAVSANRVQAYFTTSILKVIGRIVKPSVSVSSSRDVVAPVRPTFLRSVCR